MHRGSETTAKRFIEEALKRKSEIQTTSVKPYLRKILLNLETILQQTDRQDLAEDALMYSTIIQNYSRQYLL
jgi:hypothetical protein